MALLSKKVCVTGGNGYLGSWLVMKLLNHGYSVNTTIRSDKDMSFLKNIPGASERLNIFKADLNQPDSFQPAIQGCNGVFLVAHPMEPDASQSQETITENSINSTLAILQACIDSKMVKRVVYTSSVASVMFGNKNSSSNVVDESSWSDIDLICASMPSMATYMITKTLTEKAALEFAGKHGLELVTVLPSSIHGSFIGPEGPKFVYFLMTMFFGKADAYNYMSFTELVHVDDVASAHIFLLEHPEAEGRYICSAVETTPEKLSEFLSSRYPEYQISTLDSSGESGRAKSYKLSSKKLLDLGFSYKHGLEEIYDGALESFKRVGVL
ncbi:hypothetical protein BUALT_Bualt19G0017300 [Buddleja alternifolia]|uniref:Dihydroflavonol 4-reductase n=1 Tax=Buddleja alternifolia TaxID=168488 RepID=A0AAV6W182_9LAMI|nr:hypothetical protein BUALT_Bualt19G0017300 [Buddleja alternifolia]